LLFTEAMSDDKRFESDQSFRVQHQGTRVWATFDSAALIPKRGIIAVRFEVLEVHNSSTSPYDAGASAVSRLCEALTQICAKRNSRHLPCEHRVSRMPKPKTEPSSTSSAHRG